MRAWAAKHRVGEEVLGSECEFWASRGVWSLKRQVLNQIHSSVFGDYVFSALQTLCGTKEGVLVGKQMILDGFAASKLPEASDTLYKRVMKLVATAERSKWKLKSGEIDPQ